MPGPCWPQRCFLRVADDLKLRNRVEFNSELGSLDTASSVLRLAGIGAPIPGEAVEDRVLGVVRRQLQIAPVKDSRIIPIRFTSADPRLAAAFANRLAEAYRTSLVTAPVEETGQVVKVLGPKVEQLRREVLEAEAVVERFRARTGQFRAGSQRMPINDQRMAALNDELIKAETARAEAEARWRTATELLNAGSADVLPEVQKSLLIQGLISQRVRLERQIAEAEAGAALLPAHPRMRQLSADLAGLKRQIAAEVRKVVQGLDKDFRATTLKVDSAQRQIEQLKQRVVDLSGSEAELKALESTANAKRTELERLQKLLEDNRTVVSTRQVPVEAQIIQARASSVPVAPKKMPMTLLAMAATFILGLAFIITRTLLLAPMRGTSRGRPARVSSAKATPPVPEDVARGEPVLSAPPQRVSAVAEAGDMGAPPRPQLSPSVAQLVSRLAKRPGNAGGVRTLVTSEEVGVDVRPEARALAEALAAAGQHVVLIVWSLAGRGLPVARSKLHQQGLMALLQGTVGFEEVIIRLPDSGVHLIQPGTAPKRAADVLDSDRLNLTLDALDEVYDQVIVAGDHADAARLFEAVEGRFDAAVLVALGGKDTAAAGGSDRLLGFHVADIDVVVAPRQSQRPPQPDAPAGPAAGRRRLQPVR